MPEPVANRCPPPNYNLDDGLHASGLGKDPNIGINDDALPMPEEQSAADFIFDHRKFLKMAAAGFVDAASAVLAPVLVAEDLLTAVIRADMEGAALNQAYHQDRMKGAVAFIAGYADSPEVQARAAESLGFRDGLLAADRLGHTSIPEEQLLQLVNYIRPRAKDGEAAVISGQDEGVAFEARYDQDAAFRAGVDHMRYLEQADPAAFAEAAANLAEDRSRLECDRFSTLRP